MCGIHLIIQKEGEPDDGNIAIEKMVRALSHRGPDGFSWKKLEWKGENIWVGHNLLAISETKENAKQPMFGDDGSFGIVFNGQIYNHLQLRSVLEKRGVQFKNNSDTETLLYWVKIFGRRGLQELKGMFAFVFWDTKRKLLISHKDGYGIKPLYIARNRKYLVISSETKAIIESGLFPFSINKDKIGQYLQYKFIPGDETMWYGIKSFKPGEIMEYWEEKPLHFILQKQKSIKNPATLRQAISEGFSQVIPERMPCGLMLSGGIDSTIILNFCLENGIEVVPFSIRYSFGKPEDFADQQAVEYLAERFKLEINWIDIGLTEMDSFLDFPNGKNPLVADGAWYLTEKIALEANKLSLKVLLSGAGADEWFAGYRRHFFFNQWLKFEKFIPEKIKYNLVKQFMGQRFSLNNAQSLNSSEIWKTATSSKLTPLVKESNQIAKPINIKSLEDALLWDRQNYLPNDILNITDLATMANGIEGRFPFLHPEITDFASRFSSHELLKNGRKWILKEYLKPLTSEKFVNRKKRGFGLPLEYYFSTENGRNRISKCLSDPALIPFFNAEQWQEKSARMKAKPENWTMELLSLFWLSKWLLDQSPSGANVPLG